MTVNMNIQVVGINDAMRNMRSMNRELANALRRDARKIMQPLVKDAQAAVPDVALSGMQRKWVSPKTGVQLFPWDGALARKYIKAKTSQKKPEKFGEYTRNLAAFYVSWAGGVNAMFDMAGRRRGSILANNLTDKFGAPSRVMWPAAEKNQQAIEAEMTDVVKEFMRKYNELLRAVS